MSDTPDSDTTGKKSIRKPLPPLEFLQECFDYYPDNGKLIWKERPLHHFSSTWRMNHWNSNFAFLEAGAKRTRKGKDGLWNYMSICFQNLGTFQVHIIIFALMGVEIPDDKEVDHKDGDPWNNKWDNLRIGIRAQNCQNRKSRADKKSGLPKGVTHWHDRNGVHKFLAALVCNGKYHSLGVHVLLEDAVAARKAAEAKYFGEWNREEGGAGNPTPPTTD